MKFRGIRGIIHLDLGCIVSLQKNYELYSQVVKCANKAKLTNNFLGLYHHTISILNNNKILNL